MKYSQSSCRAFTIWAVASFSMLVTLPFSAQPLHDLCENAINIQVVSDEGFVCVESNNTGASPESFNNNCSIGEYPVVWFRIEVDAFATFINISVQSYEMKSPTISLFRATPDCTNLVNNGCLVGSNGKAEANAWFIQENNTYFIAVGALHSLGGEFYLCVNTVSQFPNCATTADIVIEGRTGSGPLSGPFFPGETVSICMNVNQFEGQEGCQWFQGIVPVFGNAWDPASFDQQGQPHNATVNGNPMGNFANGLYGNATWDWFADVGYHFQNDFYQVGDHDGNGSVDLCHTMFDSECFQTGGLDGGWGPPCWDNPGDLLPPGWFAYGINGTCNFPGPPVSYDWGDGINCSASGPWSFCFDLAILEYPDCLANVSMPDLSLAFFVFADGEIGSWGSSIPAASCSNDRPLKLNLPFCCELPEEEDIDLDTIYSGQQVYFELYHPGVLFWEWTSFSGFVMGENAGEGDSNAVINDTLVNTTNEARKVRYDITGYSNGVCPNVKITLDIWVLPEIFVTLEAPLLCSEQVYILSPEVVGCSPVCTYMWSPGNETTPSITLDDPVDGAIYSVTVTDSLGTTASASVVLSVYSTFEVMISPSSLEYCANEAPVELVSEANGGNEPYTALWLLPNQAVADGEQIFTSLCGEHIVLYMDDTGCTGRDTIDVICLPYPEVEINSINGDSICLGDSSLLATSISGGTSPFSFEWQTPGGNNSNAQIHAIDSGIYIVSVIDANGCIGTNEISISVHHNPVVDLGPDSIVVVDMVTLDAGNQGSSYIWSNGDTTQTINVIDPGLYSVEVVDSLGCSASDSIFVDVITHVTQIDQTSFINIFPNPNAGEFSISMEGVIMSPVRIRILDNAGRKMYDKEVAIDERVLTHDIKMDLAIGSYSVVIHSYGLYYVGKMVVMEK